MKQMSSPTRRTVLRLLGASAVGASLGVGSVAAHEHDRLPDWEHVSWGDALEMGEGEVRTYVTHSGDGVSALGLYFTAGTWEGLPSPEEEPHAHFALDFPAAAGATPFVWAGVDWAPEGHPPVEVYDVPHLDVHFYLVDQETVHAIPPDADYQVALAADQHPPGYVRSNEVVPMMGEHLVDPTAPEFQGEPFTHTFIWGAYDGNLTFYEPMVTVDYLTDLTDGERADIAMPEAFAQAGEYPTKYAIRYLSEYDAYTVSLECFSDFPASNGN